MYFEDKMHKILPALCIAMGVILVVGAAYIGMGHVFTLGYAMMGVTCIIAGAVMAVIRRKAPVSELRLTTTMELSKSIF